MTRPPVAPGDRSVPWKDVCPKAWPLEPVKYVCSINRRALPETTAPDTEFRYLDISGVDSDGNWVASEPMRFADAPSRARRVVQDGDVLVSTVRTYLRAIAHIDKVEEPLICSTGFAVLSANGAVHSKFLAYWARSVYFVDEVVARSVGVSYPAVNASDVGNIPCPLLPLDRQRAVVRFLDREAARIDALIEKKRRQIELLHEKRAALISHAVTKGLDPNAPMKDSGIEWLGEVPAQWDVVRIGRKIELQRGVDITKDEQNDGGVPVVSSGGISSFHDKAIAPNPGVVVGRKGTVGAVYYIESDFWPHDTTLWVKEFRGNDPRYVYYKLCTMDLPSFDTGSANPTLNRNLLHPVVVSWPPIEEQRDIVQHLDIECDGIDRLVEKVELSIDRLREYRTALISAAVTGKIDVHKEVA